jgi:hypothetical protein
LTAKSYGKLHEMDQLLLDQKMLISWMLFMIWLKVVDIQKKFKDYNSHEITRELKTI